MGAERRAARRDTLQRVKGRLLALLLLASVLAAGGAGVGTTAGQPVATASASGITVVVPGQPPVSSAVASAPGGAESGVVAAFAHPADGSIARTGSISSSAAAQPVAAPTAHAVVDVLGVSLFNGEVTFDAASGRAKAGAPTDIAGSAVSNLVILGQPVSAAPNQRFALGDWGFLVTLEGGAEETEIDGTREASAGVTAVHVTLTAEHAGLPAGSEILIGHAQVSTSAELAPEPPQTTTATTTTTKATTTKATKPEKPKRRRPPEPGKGAGLPKPVRTAPTDIDAPLSPAGYVFPVYGPSSFSDTYGAPRAHVTWHHGEDIFAPLGAPVLAVADGTVFSVGWNDVGGYRFWLRDRQGNQFYYAHLSAFSPMAVENRSVRAGDVIGFVGNTGDAQGTPYHLHFEIHPVSLLPMGYDGVVNPFLHLSAWRRLQDVSFAAGRGWAPPVPANATAPRPGAFLLGAADISSASGLEPGALERALVAPVSAEGDGALLRG
jgi:murein DD-endopeptidase MepM/ murein hydrolase activator NlpD